MNVIGGTTNVTTYFVLRLAATGVEASGLTVTNFDLQYVRTGTAPSAKVDATALAATDTAHTDNYAIEVDATDAPGLYRVDWPDAAFAAGVRQVILTVKCATCFTEHMAVEIDPPVGIAASVSGAVGSVTGAVGSVTGAVGSVTGAVGSVTGAVGSVTGNVGGNVVGSVASVTGAVGSVTGNVGGNVTGSVGSVAAGGITAASIANAAIDFATFAADCITGTGLKANVESVTAGAITAAAVATGAIDADALAADAGTEIGTAVWATAARTLTAATNITSTGGTTFTQTGDSYVRLGAPAGASVSADVAAVKVDTAAILVDTGTTLDGRIPAALVGGRMDASVGAVAAGAITATAIATDAIDADAMADGAITAATFAAGAVNAAAIADGAIDAATFAAGAITAAAIATDAIDADALAADAVDEIHDEVVEGTYTFRQVMRVVLSALAGRLAGAATATVTTRDTGNTKDRITASVDADGNRTSVTLDVS